MYMNMCVYIFEHYLLSKDLICFYMYACTYVNIYISFITYKMLPIKVICKYVYMSEYMCVNMCIHE